MIRSNPLLVDSLFRLSDIRYLLNPKTMKDKHSPHDEKWMGAGQIPSEVALLPHKCGVSASV